MVSYSIYRKVGANLKVSDSNFYHLSSVTSIDGWFRKKYASTKSPPAQGNISLGELYDDSDQKENPLENLNKAKAMFREMGMDYWLTKTQEVLDRLQKERPFLDLWF